jgi:hypothetical protein
MTNYEPCDLPAIRERAEKLSKAVKWANDDLIHATWERLKSKDVEKVEARLDEATDWTIGTDIPALLAEVAVLREELLSRGRHLPNCDSLFVEFESDEPDAQLIHGTCDCGWTELKRKLESLAGEKGT